MSDAMPPFKDLLELLFRHRKRDGKKQYSDREVAAAVTASGTRMSPSYVSMLRSGSRDNPRGAHIKGLADFFGVPAGYFLDKDTFERQKSLLMYLKPSHGLPAPRRPETISLREFPGMSERSRDLLGALADYVGELENQADQDPDA